MIECKFRLIPEHNIESYKKRLKEGRYQQTRYKLEEENRYVIGAYIEFDYKKWIGSNQSEKEIIDQCVDYLNVLITPKKKKGKRLVKPFYKYGYLKPFECKISKDKNNHFFIIALLSTDDPKSKYFWGEPLSKENSNSYEKRGRPRNSK